MKTNRHTWAGKTAQHGKRLLQKGEDQSSGPRHPRKWQTGATAASNASAVKAEETGDSQGTLVSYSSQTAGLNWLKERLCLRPQLESDQWTHLASISCLKHAYMCVYAHTHVKTHIHTHAQNTYLHKQKKISKNPFSETITDCLFFLSSCSLFLASCRIICLIILLSVSQQGNQVRDTAEEGQAREREGGLMYVPKPESLTEDDPRPMSEDKQPNLWV